MPALDGTDVAVGVRAPLTHVLSVALRAGLESRPGVIERVYHHREQRARVRCIGA